MSPVYRDVNGKGWLEVTGKAAQYAPGSEWRLATAPEAFRYALTTARFSWVELVIIVIVANLVIAFARMVWP